MVIHEVLLLLLSLVGVCSCYKVHTTPRLSPHILLCSDDFSHDDYLPSDYVKGVNGMNEAFVDAFNDVYYEEIREKLESTKTSEAVPPREKSLPFFDDYSIPSWVYKNVFKHNKPRKFKEKSYVFWDRVIR